MSRLSDKFVATEGLGIRSLPSSAEVRLFEGTLLIELADEMSVCFDEVNGTVMFKPMNQEKRLINKYDIAQE